MAYQWHHRLIAFLLLHDAILLSKSETTTEQSSYPTWSYKDMGYFDDDSRSYEERCCQGKTYPKSTNDQYSCCGSSDYDTTRGICCDEKLYPLQPGYECCGENYIDTASEICCYNPSYGMEAGSLPMGDLEANETGQFTQCCGDELYDTRSYLCFLATFKYSGLANFTVVEKKYNRTGCCDGKPHDKDVGECYSWGFKYTLISRPSDIFQQLYDQVKKWNRFQNLRNRRPTEPPYNPQSYTEKPHDRLAHCGDQMYDPYYQICCGDRYHLQENGTVKIWNKTYQSRCCGTEIYSYRTHRCCNGRIVEEMKGYYDQLDCCGQELYDRGRQWCCDGSNTVMDAQPDQGEHCCGTEGLVFNTSTHICCNSRPVEVPEGDNGHLNRSWACCTSNDASRPDQIYNYYKAKCCNGVVYNISRNTLRYGCCGKEMYDTDLYTCCAGKIYNFSSCCLNKEPYNSSTHNCCEGTVVEKPSADANSCCGKTPYAPDLQTCCFDPQTKIWRATVKKSNYEECCDGKPYDSNTESCCGSSVVIDDNNDLCCHWYDHETGSFSYAVVETKRKYDICCGLSAFDWNTEICCGGTPFPDENKNLTCCGSNSYNDATQLCCRGEVYARSDDGNRRCCGKNVFDVAKEICCRGVVFSVKDVNTAKCCYGKPQKQS